MNRDLDWFPFFLRDFDDGTKEMTNEDVGAYLRLLFYQWHYGSIPADRERASRVTGERFSDATWAMLQAKFVPDPSVPADRLINKRMQAERAEAEERFARRSEANRRNGQRGGLERGRRLRTLGAPASERVASDSLANGQRSGSGSEANAQRMRSTAKKEDKTKDTTTEVSGTSEVSGPKSGRARRQRRVPDEWRIEEKLAAWIKEQFPKVATDVLTAWTKRQLQKFRNHEFNSPRSDWDATFRNWVLGCIDRGDVPSGAARGADEEAAWQKTLSLAAVLGLSRGSEETREGFTERVNERNQRRLDGLKKAGGG